MSLLNWLMIIHLGLRTIGPKFSTRLAGQGPQWAVVSQKNGKCVYVCVCEVYAQAYVNKSVNWTIDKRFSFIIPLRHFPLYFQKGRLYYVDFGLLSGLGATILGCLGFRSRSWQWLPNRNYVSGKRVILLLLRTARSFTISRLFLLSSNYSYLLNIILRNRLSLLL